ncbi:MAG: hypothetical protein LQ350_005370 [Teloschistes chrysophthalmus]|nr:MAG: hypothetical protein LQ350_005370 [Niorma chrysophthalma]
MPGAYDDCTEVTDFCVVEATTYGYYPNLGANAFFLAIFALCGAIQFFQGVKWRSWSYMIAMTVGCLGEVLGYAGRVILHSNPWSSLGFQMQIACIIIAPVSHCLLPSPFIPNTYKSYQAFFSAAIYLTLKHLILTFGPEHSRLKANWYTWIFIACDLLSLILQGAGGGIAASASTNSAADAGSHLMLAGIIWQVFTLAVFLVLAADFGFRAYGHRSTHSIAAVELRRTLKFKLFLAGLAIAFVSIFIRCIYRIAELAGGWGNSIMQNEGEFIGFEGV